MNFHGLFGAMMGDRAGGYGYINPYDQPSYSNPGLHHNPQLMQAQNQHQVHHEELIKPDPYSVISHSRNIEFFNPELYNHQARSIHQSQLGYDVYKYEEKPVLDMRVHARTHEEVHQRVHEDYRPRIHEEVHLQIHQDPQVHEDFHPRVHEQPHEEVLKQRLEGIHDRVLDRVLNVLDERVDPRLNGFVKYEQHYPDKYERHDPEKYERHDPEKYERHDPEKYERQDHVKYEIQDNENYERKDHEKYEIQDNEKNERQDHEKYERQDHEKYERQDHLKKKEIQDHLRKKEIQDNKKYERQDHEKYEMHHPDKYQRHDHEKYGRNDSVPEFDLRIQKQLNTHENPYGQIPLFFPHFLQNIRPPGPEQVYNSPVLTAPLEKEKLSPTSDIKATEQKTPGKKKTTRKRNDDLQDADDEFSLEDDAILDIEDVPDHEKVFTERIDEMCQCLCKICNTTMKFRSLREHVRFQHSMNIQMYKEKYGNIYTRLTYHRCKMCDKVIKASYDFLNNHVSKVHKMSFAQYRTKFEIFKGRSKKIFKRENGGMVKVFTDRIEEMCLCKCALCELELEPYNMRHHVKSKHKIALDEYRDTCGEIEFTRETFHRCKLCQKEILFEYQKLSSHLYSGHSLGISKYINLFLSSSDNSAENENTEISSEHECRICCASFPSNKFRYHLQSEHSLNTRKYEETFGHINDFQYRSSDDVGDMCSFKCKICDIVLQAQDFSVHLSTEHSLNLKAYRGEHGKLTFENKTFHRCKECEKDILFTIAAIKRHLETKHSMTLKKYKIKYNIFTELKDKVSSVLVKQTGKSQDKNNVEGFLLKLKEEGREEELLKAPEGVIFANSTADMCKYSCLMCKEELTLLAIKKHLPKEHGLSLQKYIKQFGVLQPVQLVYHRCKVCSSELIFNREDVTGHLKRAHSLSYGQYKSFFNGFSDVMTAKPELPAPRRSRRNNSILAELEPEILTSDSRIPVCQYACKECNSVFNRRQLIKHVIKVHKLTYKDYRSKHGSDTPLVKIYHSCKICSTRLLACYDTLKSHARDKHNITFREYRGVCEELLNTEFKSEDILDNPVLASALNIKMEPGYGSSAAMETDVGIKNENQDSRTGSEFDHDDVAYAMSVEYGLEEEEKRRSCTGNNQSLDKDENMNIDGIKDEDESSPMDDFYDQR